MAKTQSPTALNPDLYILGAPVLVDGTGLLPLLQLINHTFGKRSECHVSQSVGEAGWDDWSAGTEVAVAGSGNAVACAGHTVSGALIQRYQWELWLDKDEATNAILGVGAECQCVAANEVTNVFTATGGVGSDTGTALCTNADNETEVADSASLDLSSVSAGGEWVTVGVTSQRTTGASANNRLRTFRVEVLDVTSGLPDPAND